MPNFKDVRTVWGGGWSAYSRRYTIGLEVWPGMRRAGSRRGRMRTKYVCCGIAGKAGRFQSISIPVSFLDSKFRCQIPGIDLVSKSSIPDARINSVTWVRLRYRVGTLQNSRDFCVHVVWNRYIRCHAIIMFCWT